MVVEAKVRRGGATVPIVEDDLRQRTGEEGVREDRLEGEASERIEAEDAGDEVGRVCSGVSTACLDCAAYRDRATQESHNRI